MTTTFDDLLEANRLYAQDHEGGFDGIARAGVLMVTCMDSRIDPLAMIGLKEGDAKILRNPGGRVTDAALEQAEAHASEPLVIVAGDGWHPGVVGIVASRLKERFGRPAIVIGVDEEGIGKGSGRSINGVDLGAAILAAKDSGLLVAGGGHAMAAGVTVTPGGVGLLVGPLGDDEVAVLARGGA